MPNWATSGPRLHKCCPVALRKPSKTVGIVRETLCVGVESWWCCTKKISFASVLNILFWKHGLIIVVVVLFLQVICANE